MQENAEGTVSADTTKTQQKEWIFSNGIARGLQAIVMHVMFEIVIAALISGNALVMCFEVQYEGLQIGADLQYNGLVFDVNSDWPEAKRVFNYCNWLFGVVFLLEALIKIAAFGYLYFCRLWNWLDFTCVVAFLVDTAIQGNATIDAHVLRLVRLFRLARLIRLIRVMEGLDMLYMMTTAIQGMTMIFTWATALLTLMLATCALFLSQYLQSMYFKDANVEDLTPSELSKQREVYQYFGTFSRCMLSMFEITMANWPPVARLLVEEVSEWFSVICVLHKLTLGFAVIGVINGVILQETFRVAQTDDTMMVRQRKRQKRAMKRKMDTLMEVLDVDKSGEITFAEFMVTAEQPDVKMWLESLDIETDDLVTLFMLIDEDANGTITKEELLTQTPRLRGFARGIDMLAVRRGLPCFHRADDRDEDGHIVHKYTELPHDIEAIHMEDFTWSEDDALPRNVENRRSLSAKDDPLPAMEVP